jgi:hypothetical protein
VLVRASACGAIWLGYSFADIAARNLIDAYLKRAVVGRSALHIAEIWAVMVRAVRNLGQPSTHWAWKCRTIAAIPSWLMAARFPAS